MKKKNIKRLIALTLSITALNNSFMISNATSVSENKIKTASENLIKDSISNNNVFQDLESQSINNFESNCETVSDSDYNENSLFDNSQRDFNDLNYKEPLNNKEETNHLIYKELFVNIGEYNITVTGNMPDGTELVVNKIENGYAEEKINENLKSIGEYKESATFDIKLINNGKHYQPEEFGENVKVLISGTDAYNGPAVYRFNQDDSIDSLSAEGEDGNIVFETEHFTLYTIGNTQYYNHPNINRNYTASWDISAYSNGGVMAFYYENAETLVISGLDNQLMRTFNGAYSGLNEYGQIKVHRKQHEKSENEDYDLYYNNSNINWWSLNITPWSLYRDLIKHVVVVGNFNVPSLAYFMDEMYMVEDISLPEGFGRNTTSIEYAFRNMSSLKQLVLPNEFAQNARSLNYAFAGMSAINEISLPDTFGQNAYYYKGVFDSNGATTINLNKLFGRDAQDASYCFNNCKNLRYITIPDWTFSKATNLEHFMDSCETLKKIRFPDYFGISAINLNSFLRNCTQLDRAEFGCGGFARNARDISHFFENSRNLYNLDLSNWEVSNVNTMDNFVDKCRKLQVLNLKNWRLANLCQSTYLNLNTLKKIQTFITPTYIRNCVALYFGSEKTEKKFISSETSKSYTYIDNFGEKNTILVCKGGSYVENNYKVTVPAVVDLNLMNNRYEGNFLLRVTGDTSDSSEIIITSPSQISLISENGDNVNVNLSDTKNISTGEKFTDDGDIKYKHDNEFLYSVYSDTAHLKLGKYSGTINFSYKVTDEK